MEINPHALKAIRERSGYSQAQLSRITGISQGHISQLEKGEKNPRPAMVRRLADALAVPMGALLNRSEVA